MAPAGFHRGLELALADYWCSLCSGLGRVELRRRNEGSKERTCYCVWRRVFRTCLTKFLKIQALQFQIRGSRCTLEPLASGGGRRTCWSRLNEDYAADFSLIAKRVLCARDLRILEMWFLDGFEGETCARTLGMQLPSFYHAAYRVEEQLGRAYAELRPYALYPVDEYFSGVRRGSAPVSAPAELVSRRPLHPPVRTAAAA